MAEKEKEKKEKTLIEIAIATIFGAGGTILGGELYRRLVAFATEKAQEKLSDTDNLRGKLGRAIATCCDDIRDTARLRKRLAAAQADHREDILKDRICTMFCKGDDETVINKILKFLNDLDDAEFNEFMELLHHDDWAQLLVRFLEGGGKIAQDDAKKLGYFLKLGESKLNRTAGHAAKGLNHLADWFASHRKGGL